MRIRGQVSRVSETEYSSVQQDWRAWLPESKAEVYNAFTQQLESLYLMFSVALDEALALRSCGKLHKSCQAVFVIPSLCKRLAHPLAGLLRALGQHAKHYGTIPNAAPLKPSNFQSARGQRTARMNDLLSRVLLTQRSQFLHKITTLQEMVEDLAEDFRSAAEEVGLGLSVHPQTDWRAVDVAHYDLNTCLREALILLKSFLVAVPESQLGAFQKTVRDQMAAPESPSRLQYDAPPKRLAVGGGK